VQDYHQHAISEGSDASAATYVQVEIQPDQTVWGVGLHSDVQQSGVHALFSALNRSLKDQ